MRWTSSIEPRPLMRRINSILLGHHGASGRTPCIYLRMASCVAGSSQESGRCTTRDSTTMSSRSGRSEEHTSELQSHLNLVCRLLLEKKKNNLHIKRLH